MEAYTSFASVYDTFMDNIPYEEWSAYVRELLVKYGVTEGLVLELGLRNRNDDGIAGISRIRYDRNR